MLTRRKLTFSQHCSQICAVKSRLQRLSNANVHDALSCAPLMVENPATRHSSRLFTLGNSHEAHTTHRNAQTDGRMDGQTVPYRETFDRVLIPDIYTMSEQQCTGDQSSPVSSLSVSMTFAVKRSTIVITTGIAVSRLATVTAEARYRKWCDRFLRINRNPMLFTKVTFTVSRGDKSAIDSENGPKVN